MRKIFLLFAFVIPFFAGYAQLYLTGTSYTQNFDSIGSGLPTGWSGYKFASSSSLGTPDTFFTSEKYGAYYDTVNCISYVYGRGFKNCASADVTSPTESCTGQQMITNRAFGVRQTSPSGAYPGYDPGAAFVLHLANTVGVKGMNLSFNLQSLDMTSPRVTTWTVDYGFGASPTVFTPLAVSGSLITGNKVFSNSPITGSFGNVLDNQNQDVWIRIAALSSSTSSGNRTTTAIDDFMLTWSPDGVNDLSSQLTLTFTILGEASSNEISFGYQARKAGLYNLSLHDMTGRSIYNQKIEIRSASHSDITVRNLNLPSGIYIAHLHGGQISALVKVVIR